MVSLIKREYDYALRISAYLAALDPGEGKTIHQLAERLELSPALTTRIVYQLIRGKVLKSRRGRHGGIYFDRDLASTSMFDILSAMEYDSSVNACLVQEDICPLVRVCPIRRNLMKIDEDLIRFFRNRMLKDMLLHERMFPKLK